MQVDQNFLLGGNKLLKLIEPGTVRKILRGSQFIKVRENQVLYKEGDPARNHSYIVLIGQLTLHSNYYQKVCTVDRGDTLGEEGLFESDNVVRKETATAKGNDAFVVELMKENIDKLDQEL